MNEAEHIQLLTRSHAIVLFLDVLNLLLVIGYLLAGTSPHTVLIVSTTAVVVVRIIRQLRDKQHIPLNIVAKTGTVLYIALTVTLIVTTAKAGTGMTALIAIAAASTHLGWRYLQWSLDKTALTHRQLWRIIGVATDDTPSMRFDSYGPTRVRRSTVAKALSGSPLALAWAARVVRMDGLSDRLRMVSKSLEYGDFIADGPSQQDAVLGWVHAIPQPYRFKSLVTGSQITRPSSQPESNRSDINRSEPPTQPLTPVPPEYLPQPYAPASNRPPPR